METPQTNRPTLRINIGKNSFFNLSTGLQKEFYLEINRSNILSIIDTRDLPTWGINDFFREFEYHGNELKLIEKYGKKFETVTFIARTSKNRQELEFELLSIEIEKGDSEFGTDKNSNYFVLKLGKVL